MKGRNCGIVVSFSALTGGHRSPFAPRSPIWSLAGVLPHCRFVNRLTVNVVDEPAPLPASLRPTNTTTHAEVISLHGFNFFSLSLVGLRYGPGLMAIIAYRRCLKLRRNVKEKGVLFFLGLSRWSRSGFSSDWGVEEGNVAKNPGEKAGNRPVLAATTRRNGNGRGNSQMV